MNWQELTALPLGEIVAWAEEQPWARAMARCQQDAAWHAEGDVWTHTKLVCDQLPQLAEWPALTRREQTLLIFTALFHDSAKPLTSLLDETTGHIRSPNHAVKGEHLVRDELRELGCDLQTREVIARLVRYHGRPQFFAEKAEPKHEVVGLSWHVNNKVLYLFALADTRGRDARETTRPEETLHLFRLLCEEMNCLDEPYAFANDQARFLFYRQAKPDLFYAPYENYRCRVTMICGLPGAGKDTWLAQHAPEIPVVALDGIRDELDVSAVDNQGAVIQLARERCREYLRAGQSFAFNATNLLRQTRGNWINLFADYNARIDLVYVEPPLDTIVLQNKQRGRQVPEKVIRDLAAKTEPPTWAEGHGLILCEQATP
jgi:predicted kinase